jgi:hypothetical protein
MDEWGRDDSLHINFKIDRFDLNDSMKFSQVWYYNIYLYHRVVFFHYFEMNPFSNSFLSNHQKEKEYQKNIKTWNHSKKQFTKVHSKNIITDKAEKIIIG